MGSPSELRVGRLTSRLVRVGGRRDVSCGEALGTTQGLRGAGRGVTATAGPSRVRPQSFPSRNVGLFSPEAPHPPPERRPITVCPGGVGSLAVAPRPAHAPAVSVSCACEAKHAGRAPDVGESVCFLEASSVQDAQGREGRADPALGWFRPWFRPPCAPVAQVRQVLAGQGGRALLPAGSLPPATEGLRRGDGPTRGQAAQSQEEACG